MTVDDVTRRERTISGALALAMHVLFLILLVVGVSWQSQRTAAPVAVELWSELPPAARPTPQPPPPPEPVKQAPRPEPRPEPKPEYKPAPDPQIAIKEQLLKKKQQQEERERLEREQKEKLAKERAEKERKQKEAEAKRLKEIADQKRREEEKKKLAEKQRQEALKAAQEKEAALAKLLAQQKAQQAADAAARARLDVYSRLVGERIKRYIVEPPNMQGRPEAVFTVVQIPGGEIIDLKLKRSSGNPAYDAAVERAIRRAAPLPPPPDPARFSEVRELELIIRPEAKP